MRAFRYDFQRLDGVTKTPQGGLRIPANLTRTGIFEYRRADGTTSREYRPPEEVFSADALASFHSAPLTIGHVPAVNADNWAAVAVGHVNGTPTRSGDFVASDCTVARGDAVRQVEAGDLVEVSCGYEIEFDPTPGEINGQKYDGVHRKIRGNHVALLPKGAGRAGPDVRLRTDSVDEYPGGVSYCADIAGARADSESAYPVTVSTQTTPVTPVSAPVLPAATPDALLGRIDALTSENADLKKRLDALPAQIEAAASERSALLARVAPHMPKDAQGQPWRADGKSEGVILREALTAIRPDVKLDGRSDDYVRGAYEEALRGVETSRANAGSMQAPLHPAFVRADADPDMDALEKQNKAKKQKSADAWKTPAKGSMTRDSFRK